MDELTFKEFVQEIVKAIFSVPHNLYKLYTEPKPMAAWILTCLITVLILSFIASVVITNFSPVR